MSRVMNQGRRQLIPRSSQHQPDPPSTLFRHTTAATLDYLNYPRLASGGFYKAQFVDFIDLPSVKASA